MDKRWVIAISVFAIISFLLWAGARQSIAVKDEQFYSLKILNKLETVLENQNKMLGELKSIKDMLKESAASE